MCIKICCPYRETLNRRRKERKKTEKVPCILDDIKIKNKENENLMAWRKDSKRENKFQEFKNSTKTEERKNLIGYNQMEDQHILAWSQNT